MIRRLRTCFCCSLDPPGEGTQASHTLTSLSFIASRRRRQIQCEQAKEGVFFPSAIPQQGVFFPSSTPQQDVEQLRMDLSRYAISRAFNYHFIRNEQTRVTIACKVTTCQWSLHAIRIGCEPQFKIKSLNNVHMCGRGLEYPKTS
ncbi:hypothetical protein Taro_054283 [Colocasia esculenta]|uniref:Transposase MuDR plant domain-containing protein n=1 Tax=Colocasia esculenta TaxID=4460 RepID=A0A843XQ92_COLES|nr:hypothetical protein [Colocasia esculenta]